MDRRGCVPEKTALSSGLGVSRDPGCSVLYPRRHGIAGVTWESCNRPYCGAGRRRTTAGIGLGFSYDLDGCIVQVWCRRPRDGARKTAWAATPVGGSGFAAHRSSRLLPSVGHAMVRSGLSGPWTLQCTRMHSGKDRRPLRVGVSRDPGRQVIGACPDLGAVRTAASCDVRVQETLVRGAQGRGCRTAGRDPRPPRPRPRTPWAAYRFQRR